MTRKKGQNETTEELVFRREGAIEKRQRRIKWIDDKVATLLAEQADLSAEIETMKNSLVVLRECVTEKEKNTDLIEQTNKKILDMIEAQEFESRELTDDEVSKLVEDPSSGVSRVEKGFSQAKLDKLIDERQGYERRREDALDKARKIFYGRWK